MILAALIAGLAIGAFVGWLVGDMRASDRVNRQWTMESYARHVEHKYQLGLAGLTINSHRTDL